MPEPTPEAWAQIRHDYEHTDRPLAHICADNDITIPMLRYRMKRWEWTRRKPLIPREGPPPVTAMQRDVDSPPPVRAANGGDGSGVGGICAAERVALLPPIPTPPAFANASTGDPPHRHSASETRVNALMAGGGMEYDAPDRLTSPVAHAAAPEVSPTAEANAIVPRLQSAVARVLPAIEVTIARLAAGPQHPREMEQAGRTLNSLTRTLRELDALLGQHNANAADNEPPQDMDAFRNELARRLRGIIAARKQRIEAAKAPET